MYRQRQATPLNRLFRLILLGIVAGVSFLIFDSIRNAPPSQDPAPQTAPTDMPLAEATVLPPQTPAVVADVALPTATSLPSVVSLVIPSAAVNAPIIDVYLIDGTWDVSRLGTSVGHLQGTARPGDVGNIVLSGHVELRDGTKGAFGFLNQMSVGDRVFLRTGNTQTQYVITEIYNTHPTDLRPVYPSTSPRLTLITCDAYDFLSNTYLERTIVVAEPLG